MFCDQMRASIEAARTPARLEDLARAIWQAWAAQAVSDDDAEQLAGLIHARKSAARGEREPVGRVPGRPSIFPPRRAQRAPARAIAIARRRQLAASGPMPPALAAHFTTAELAALRIVGDEVRARGSCDRTIAEIAARAGCGRTTVQNALREAAALGLVTVAERRREGRKNDPNVIRIVSREWLAWLAKGPRNASVLQHSSTVAGSASPIGFKTVDPTDRESKNRGPQMRNRGFAAEGQQAALAVHNGRGTRRG